jgi:hypothetical protein
MGTRFINRALDQVPARISCPTGRITEMNDKPEAPGLRKPIINVGWKKYSPGTRAFAMHAISEEYLLAVVAKTLPGKQLAIAM